MSRSALVQCYIIKLRGDEIFYFEQTFNSFAPKDVIKRFERCQIGNPLLLSSNLLDALGTKLEKQ